MTNRICYFITALFLCFGTLTYAESITGIVKDAETETPIALATILVPTTNQSILTNDDGQFSLKLQPGTYTLKFSHVAFYSHIEEITINSDVDSLVIYLNPALIEISPINVYERNYDAAQIIIRNAIKRKDAILQQLSNYSFDAYTKLALYDTAKADSISMIMLTETQLTGFWKYPDRYKEIITARKQSANIDAADNLVTVGEILNFNQNRIDMGRYSIVSPTAKDALDYYNYYLLDTIFVDSNRVFLLEVEPKSNTTPLFKGMLQIVDSVFAVTGVEFTLNEGFDNPVVKKMNFYQEFQLFENEFWMPTIIKYNGIVDIPFPGFPTISFDYTAALHQYHFESKDEDSVFNEYALEVDKHADDFDSTAWYANQLVPLTDIELAGYNHIDSVEHNKPLYKKLLLIVPASIYFLTSANDFFHFNKIEGTYLGGRARIKPNSRLTIIPKAGYALEAERWKYDVTSSYLVAEQSKLYLNFNIHDKITNRPTLVSAHEGSATLKSLLSKLDPYDYFIQKGFSAGISFNLTHKTNFSFDINSFKQWSVTNNTNYSWINKDSAYTYNSTKTDSTLDSKTVYRVNPTIQDGYLRSLTAKFVYDSRDKVKMKDKDVLMFSYPYTTFGVGIEYSSPSLFNSEFEYSRLTSQFYTSRRVLGLGIGSLGLYGGFRVSGHIPAQRYFTMDYNANMFDDAMIFHTLVETNFTGANILSAYYTHDFDRLLFRKSGIPLIKDIPLSLSLYGGIFVTNFDKNSINQFPLPNYTGNTPYSEIGFGIGRLPLLMKFYFTWQISDYDTERFTIGMDFGF